MNRVLIVDDESSSRQGLSELVRSWGFATDVAADGAEGLDKVRAFRPQVVIADLVMPRMDGLGLLSGLGDESHHLAVVMLTAKGSIATAVEDIGPRDWCVTPVVSARAGIESIPPTRFIAGSLDCRQTCNSARL